MAQIFKTKRALDFVEWLGLNSNVLVFCVLVACFFLWMKDSTFLLQKDPQKKDEFSFFQL